MPKIGRNPMNPNESGHNKAARYPVGAARLLLCGYFESVSIMSMISSIFFRPSSVFIESSTQQER